MRKKQFFKKLFWSFLFLVMLYTCISFGVFMLKNQELIKYREKTSQESFMRSSSKTMDTTLKVGLNWINQLRINDFVEDYAKSEEQDYYAITQIYKELNKIGSVFSDFGYKIGVSKPSDNTVITPTKTQSKDSFFQSLNMTNSTFLQKLDRADKLNKQMTFQYFENSSYFTIFTNEQINQGDNISFFLSFWKDYYFPDTSDHELFGIYSDDHFFTNKQNLSFSVEEVLTDKVIDKLKDDNKFSPMYTNTESNNYTVHMIRSDVLNDLYYIYLTPQKSVNPFNQPHLLTTIGYILLAIVLGGGLAYFIANRAYRPVGRVFKVFQEYNDINKDSKSFDELKYMEDNYISVKENNETLQQIVQSNGETLKSTFLKNVMLGLLIETEIEDGIKKYNLLLLNQPLRVILIELDNRIEVEKNFSQETIQLLKAQLLRNIRDELSVELELETFELEHLRYGVIIKDNDLEIIKRILQSTFIHIEQYSSLQLIGAIGSVATYHIDLNKSYSDASKVLEYRYAITEKSVITLDDLKNVKDTSFYYPIEKERDLISYVIQGDKKISVSILEEILAENLKDRYLDKNDYRQFVSAIVGTINRVLHMIGNDPETVFGHSNLFANLMLVDNKLVLTNQINDYIKQLLEHINESKEQTEQIKKEEMIEFIHNHYQRDLSLQDLAENFNLSAGYISTLFKKYTGENFKDYLNIYRVKIAKELLETKEYKIAEIAELVGCNSTNTFIRIFKKYEGISPGKYMKNERGIV